MSADERAARRAKRIEAALSVPKREIRRRKTPRALPAQMRPDASTVTVRSLDTGEVLRTIEPKRPTRRGGRPNSQWQGPRRPETAWTKIVARKPLRCDTCGERIHPGRWAMQGIHPTRPRIKRHACLTCEQPAD